MPASPAADHQPTAAGADFSNPQLHPANNNVSAYGARQLRVRPPAPRPASISTRAEPAPPPWTPTTTAPHVSEQLQTRQTNGAVSNLTIMPRSHLTALSYPVVPRLTKTGRISKAKKGLKDAHICDRCGKRYSRNEHLRRHQQNHEPAKLQCSWPRCGRSFSRQDLLERHELKHSDTGERRRPSTDSGTSSAPASGAEAKRGSMSSAQKESTSILSAEVMAFPINPIPHQTPPLDKTPTATAMSLSDGSKESATQATIDFQASTLGAVPTATNALAAAEDDGFNFIFNSAVTFGAYAANDCATFDGFTDLTLDQHWPIFPSTSISPLSTTPQLPYLEPDIGQFSLSVASSPRSQHAILPSMKMVSQVTGGVPYPLPWNGHCDGLGSLSLEGTLEEQQLGRHLSLDKKQHFVEAYWKHFHPLYPILHWQTYQRHKANPLFRAAVMAVGAQFSNRGFARSDSRILHEKCQDLILKYKEDLKATTRLDYMQAIFLVELLSHFAAKRAPSALSEVFLAMYDQLWMRHNNMHSESIGKTQLDGFTHIDHNTTDHALLAKWRSWIQAHSFERLLVASYILDAQQALLLMRPQSLPKVAGAGLELYMPVPTCLWDLRSAAAWSKALSLQRPLETVAVFHSIGDIQTSVPGLQYDDFQSLLLIACHASSTLSQPNEVVPYLDGTQQIFDHQNYHALGQALSPNPYIQILHETVLLARSKAPLEALLAVSGESWVLSQRLSSVSRDAKEKFEALQTKLRLWVSNHQSSFQAQLHGATAHHIPLTVRYPSESEVAHAICRALKILALSLRTSPPLLLFGPEMALYYASLVLWATAYPVFPHNAFTGRPSNPDNVTELSPQDNEVIVRSFVMQAVKDFEAAPSGLGVPHPQIDDQWLDGVKAVLQWTAWVASGAPTTDKDSSGVGELMESARTVLKKLCFRGWSKGWF